MADKFKDFDILSNNYKTVGKHSIQVNVLVPKYLEAGNHPVIVRFHGGGYVTGDSLFPDWFPKWQAELALAHGAIIVSPNYRLLPESNGLDIHQDIEDFWAWLHSDLQNMIHLSFPHIHSDLSRILTAGESAGKIESLLALLS
ncbi:hypothetical protein LTS07_010131 [Exophiala sideris]|uniref:Alpha/beta hydrolase fold-3 domain-containing protein n=1 Tax=Exophiala sideris TaxID=1016849 RepID=A0ABR0IZ93_9EURO|nr:hypothetical protein LTS07_010131 [Exophiala sideris]KAK5027067.1 hypothetical protein LTR13_009677 [Exophiala sideris]KAK5051642.1 hypothetical protein LTR69_010142 [Exophiala sideris]KAK5177607.1 hypothetical protein LTR44_009797 [Eurotiomycetes sp. CCFEE 6388]